MQFYEKILYVKHIFTFHNKNCFSLKKICVVFDFVFLSFLILIRSAVVFSIILDAGQNLVPEFEDKLAEFLQNSR